MERPVCNPLEVGQKMREKERVSLSSSPPPPRQVSSWAQECLSDRGIMGADGSLQKKGNYQIDHCPQVALSLVSHIK